MTFKKTKQKLKFQTRLKEDSAFRGREMQWLPGGDVGVMMAGCYVNMETASKAIGDVKGVADNVLKFPKGIDPE
ncbi:unnamed protein product, partial [Prorocentrum cordatum]